MLVWAAPAVGQGLDAAVAQACAKLVACGCADDTCAAGFAGVEGLAPEALTCLAGRTCEELCQQLEGEVPVGVAICFDDARRAALGAAAPAAPETVAPAAPATAAPAAPETAAAEYAPAPALAGLSPTRRAAIEQACGRVAACGCADVECMKNFSEAGHLPDAVFACVAGFACDQLCVPGSGTAGSPVYEQCFAPAAVERLGNGQKAQAAAAYCEHLSGCGCGEDDCVAVHLKASTNLDAELFTCLTGRACDQICGAGKLDAGSPTFAACVAPALARKDQRLQLEMARMNAEHRVNMSIIRAMGGTSQRVRIYDGNGNYLRTETR
ncbi:MAG: hypothetical protein R3F60_17895 [bacterium]